MDFKLSANDLCNSGVDAERANDPQTALNCYLKALRIEPDHQQTLFNLTACYLQSFRDVYRATVYAKRHEELYPSAAGRRLLGLCHIEAGRTAQAVPLLTGKEQEFYSLMLAGDKFIDQENCPCGCGSAARWKEPSYKPKRKQPDQLTFGLLNKPCKARGSLYLWRQIAKATDGVFIAFALGGEQNRAVREMYEEAIPGERLKLVDYKSRAGFLDLAASVTVMLDTHPYNGILTMRDCLYVDTPVVCLPGHQQSTVRAVIPSAYLVDSADAYVIAAARYSNIPI